MRLKRSSGPEGPLIDKEVESLRGEITGKDHSAGGRGRLLLSLYAILSPLSIKSMKGQKIEWKNSTI